MAVTKLEYYTRHDADVIGRAGDDRQLTFNAIVSAKSSGNTGKEKPRAQTTGSKPRNTSGLGMPRENHKHDAKQKEHKRSRRKAAAAKEENQPGRVSRGKDLPSMQTPQEANVTGRRGINSSHIPTVTLATPLRGDMDSPLKPYNSRHRAAMNDPNFLLRLTTPATASTLHRPEKRKELREESGSKALKLLMSRIAAGTRMLEFKDMLQVKVTVGLAQHVPPETLDDLNSVGEIFDELSMRWKINRFDLDLLEYLLDKVGVLERHKEDIDNYKCLVDYTDLVVSSEREVTTIISSLHNILQGSEESESAYTTVCFLHYGDVYRFSREKLACLKQDLSNLLTIHRTQITYIAKVGGNKNGFVTLCQMPCSVCKKLVICARRNDEVLMSLGLKGIQITGSDGLRYTQSLGYLQEKITVGIQTSSPSDEGIQRRIVKPSRESGRGSVRPLERPYTRANGAQSQANYSWLMDQGTTGLAATGQRGDSPLLSPLQDPIEAKFERRIQLVKTSFSEALRPETDEFTTSLLEQIRNLHRVVASLKKDLRDKSRQLNSSQSYIKQAEKEMKIMELKLETKARQISQTNLHLIKKCKSLMNENLRLSNIVQRMEAELDLRRKIEKESKFDNVLQAVGF